MLGRLPEAPRVLDAVLEASPLPVRRDAREPRGPDGGLIAATTADTAVRRGR